MILNQAVIRTIRASKLQSLGAVSLIALAVLLYMMLSSSTDAVKESSESFKRNYKQEDFHFVTSEELDRQSIKEISKKHEVLIEERLVADVPFEKNKTIRLFTPTDSINKPFFESGKIPSQKGEIALSVGFTEKNGLQLQDEITLGGETFRVTGTFLLPDYIYGIKNETDMIHDPATFGIGIVMKDEIAKISDFPVANYLGLFLKEQVKSSSMLKKEIGSVEPILKWLDASENPRITYLDTKLQGTESFSTILPLMIVAIAMMMVVLLIKRKLEMQRKQIGTLLALGYRNLEIVNAYLIYPVLIGLLGSTIGMVIGLALSMPLTQYFTEFYNLPLLTKVSLNVGRLSAAIFLPVFLLGTAGYLVVNKQLAKKPLELMKPPIITVMLPKWSKWLSLDRISSFSMRYRLRMLSRNMSRAFYLVVGIVFSTILLMYGYISITSIDTLMNKTYKDVMKFDYAVYFKQLQNGASQNDKNVFSLSNADMISIIRDGTREQIDSKKVQLFGIDEGVELLDLVDAEGNNMIPKLKDGIVINQVLSSAYNLHEGDKIELKSATSEKTQMFIVTGIAEMYTGTIAYFERERLNAFSDFPRDTYLGEWSIEKPGVNDEILLLEDKEETIKAFASITGPMQSSVVIMSLLSFLIGLIIITLLTNLMVEENENTISLLKVMGYTEKEIAKLMLHIYTPIVFIAYFLGIPAAFWSVKAMFMTVAKDADFAMPISVEPYMTVLGFIMILTTYYVSLLLSKKKLSKISLQEVLKKQEA
ncbi:MULTISPECIES: FtsX-like permease family protein [unclassified Bacillus (in: firmicutes)]|uniref:ABC transporter permease n=1 Tax=unclassified Bacillus (in: firmicutes) TaxID=185979 RepID=UPI0008E4CB59|nr:MULTISPECIES: FtsX-like permease family protein [unclassified Bacillus (in: firmicutes)]SFA97309.1 putative ABC transport system permease protein [Bacillus sp. UNCCL13]SFQ80432.1 putative ABC transport system permease protein [Bacillus sp. cl95]